MAGLTDDYTDPEGFDACAARVMRRNSLPGVEVIRGDLQLPAADISQLKPTGRTRNHWNYLVWTRGFEPEDIRLLTDLYSVVAATSGKYHDRVLLPYIVNEEIVSWTARAVAEARIRYLDLSKDESLVQPKQTLYNHDAARDGGKVLLVTEGPFDALKLDLYGREFGVRTVALSTNSISDQQIYLLEEAAGRFKKVLIMMDNSGPLGVVDSMRMREKLSQIHNLGFARVPFGRKDGGDLLPIEVIRYCRSLQHETVY